MAGNSKDIQLKNLPDVELDYKSFRKRHFHKLDESMKALDKIIKAKGIQVRKCPHCGERVEFNLEGPGFTKNKIEAIKARARHLGALQPEKETKATASAQAAAATKVENPLDRTLTQEELDELDAYIDNENSKMVP